MNRVGRTKKLTLHKEVLRRLSHRLTELQLANVIGGNGVDAGARLIPVRTNSADIACDESQDC